MNLFRLPSLPPSLLVVLILVISKVDSGPINNLADWITSPKYFNPWPVELPLGTGINHAMKGTCQAGQVYTITSVDDLLNDLANLECIYNAGQAPNTVPLGPNYGTVLKLSTSDTFAPIIAPIWRGKLVTTTRCPAPMNMAMNFVLNRLRIAALLSVDIPRVTLAKGEYTDHRPTLIIDYTRDFSQICTTFPGSFYSNNDLSLNVLNNIFPFNRVVDVVRVVGRQADGGLIYLGKTYLEDPYREDRLAINIAFWAVVNYDPAVTNLRPGESLQPLPTTFEYMEPSALQAVRTLSPLDNMLVNPGLVLERFFGYFDAFARALSRNIGMDIRRGATRTKQVVVSHTEFLIASICSILTRNPLLMSGLSAESVAETLLLEPTGRLGFPNNGLFRRPVQTISEGFVSPVLNTLAKVFSPGTKANEELIGTSQNEKMQEVTSAVSSMTTVLKLAEELRQSVYESVEGDKSQSL